MKYTFNIGLHNNDYSKAIQHINNARGHYYDDYHVTQKDGEYNGIAEPTIILEVDTKADVVSMVELTKKWCKAMNQICIALEITDKENSSFGALVYDDSFRGHKSTFDSKYFLTNN